MPTLPSPFFLNHLSYYLIINTPRKGVSMTTRNSAERETPASHPPSAATAVLATGCTKMKVLFLDVDGVITVADGTGRLCEDKLERLQRVVLETGTQIVISSNWRLFPQLKTRLVMALHEHGGMRVVGCTPDNGERVHGDAVSLPPMPAGILPLPTLPFPGGVGVGGGERHNQPRHACGSTQATMLMLTLPPPPGCRSDRRRLSPGSRRGGGNPSRLGAPSTTGRC